MVESNINIKVWWGGSILSLWEYLEMPWACSQRLFMSGWVDFILYAGKRKTFFLFIETMTNQLWSFQYGVKLILQYVVNNYKTQYLNSNNPSLFILSYIYEWPLLNYKDDIWVFHYQSLLYLVTEWSIVIGFTIQILSLLAINGVAEFTLFPCLVYLHYVPLRLAGGLYRWEVHE